MRRPLVALALWAAPLAAQGVKPIDVGPNTPPLHQLVPLAGIHLDRATGITGNFALLLTDLSTADSYAGWFVGVEGGKRGGRIGLGRGGGPLTSFSGMFRLSYLRAWADGGPVRDGQGYVGIDFRLGIRGITGGVGYDLRVHENGPGPAHFFDASIGIGF